MHPCIIMLMLVCLLVIDKIAIDQHFILHDMCTLLMWSDLCIQAFAYTVRGVTLPCQALDSTFLKPITELIKLCIL